ncbi:succinate CoA transferase (plasmid) [Thermovirga lienii DSM 17291]|uniref:Succinate CoA transferase n=1 Tax=Thermovirga lienii (strain ATCC BAA-1197 / DSM 17291 / Cas60314) TaxID=580340 RepID=G7VAF2_THELD|nr:acetyl-CoA hydrolase/transferase family protein [Thermovirga lienii]AER67602.1 succinate CoA transferase [Thermovirga lienii DSM 17291]MDN5319229.1 succinyl-CoA:acetate CoA-transferase [Thermovirga sp.]MDN5368290.1 succinyl-CoA:acetate CoA-transferase [Thermovirga sp.]HCD72531.1 succinate CoA transferase [Thermovirga lienii]
MELHERIRSKVLREKVVSKEEAAKFIKDGMTVACSGFTPAGYPKVVPEMIAQRAQKGENIRLNIITGASTGDELDGVLARSGVIKKRYPYQTNTDCRNGINSGQIDFCDIHLSHLPQFIKLGYLGNIDIALVEAVAITEDGGIVPSTSVGATNTFVQKADKVIVEINFAQPLDLEGLHDIYDPGDPPLRSPIPLCRVSDRIGIPYIPCPKEKIVAIVISNRKDSTNPVAEIDRDSRLIAGHIIDFLEFEIKKGRFPKNLLPLQSGVGSVANAVLTNFKESRFENLEIYSEVLQDAVLELIDTGKVSFASGTAFTISPSKLDHFYKNLKFYKNYTILRPQEISNNPEVIRRLGVIAMNTAIEIDIYGNVNSTHIGGCAMMNGIGGSGDFTRNAALSIFTTKSVAKDGNISSIVPMVSHHDHTEHDVHVVVTEQGLADLRGLSPKERVKQIIGKCAHPDFRKELWDYYRKALFYAKYKHTPHMLNRVFDLHNYMVKYGTMKPKVC